MLLSQNAKLYFLDRSESKYDAIDNVSDVTITEAYEEANVTRRASLGFTEIEPTLNGIELSFTMMIVDEDDVLEGLLTAYTTRADVTILALDGLISNPAATGLSGKFKVFSATRNQALSEAQTIDFVFKPCSGATIVRHPLPEEVGFNQSEPDQESSVEESSFPEEESKE